MKWGLTKKKKSSHHSFDSFKKEIDRVFDDFFTPKTSALFDSNWLPTIDMEEGKNEFHISAELPGLDEKSINVSLENNILTISGEKKEEKEEKSKDMKYYHTERHYGSFSRSIAFPEEVHADKISAKFKNGVLSIKIPKDENAEKKRISIKVN